MISEISPSRPFSRATLREHAAPGRRRKDQQRRKENHPQEKRRRREHSQGKEGKRRRQTGKKEESQKKGGREEDKGAPPTMKEEELPIENERWPNLTIMLNRTNHPHPPEFQLHAYIHPWPGRIRSWSKFQVGKRTLPVFTSQSSFVGNPHLEHLHRLSTCELAWRCFVSHLWENLLSNRPGANSCILRGRSHHSCVQDTHSNGHTKQLLCAM